MTHGSTQVAEVESRPGFGELADFAAAQAAIADRTWLLFEDAYEPAVEHELESLFTVSNGLIGIRGSLDVPTDVSRPRTYVAGLYAQRPGPSALSVLVPAPAAFPLRLAIDGEELDIKRGLIREHSRLLDYKNGLLRSIWRHEMPSGRIVCLESLRFASLARMELAVTLLRLRLSEGGKVTLVFRPDPDAPDPAFATRVWQSKQGGPRLACQRLTRLARDGGTPSRWIASASLPSTVSCERELSILQIASYALGAHQEIARNRASAGLKAGMRDGLSRLVGRHELAWNERWRESDVVVEGDETAQAALRFALYHLNAAVRPGNSTVSIAARGLTGDGYLGHVFWDTELFMLPFYTFTWPAAARSLLEYRFLTLPAARNKARQRGFRGALFAWESTDTGDEATPPYAIGPNGEMVAIRNGDLEVHVSAAVAFGVWQYWHATHDVGFLLEAGAELLLETARFWASRVEREADGLFHIRGVIGPDEYHQDVDDNAYTNYIARWNIERGLEMADLLAQRWPARWRDLAAKIGLDPGELEHWRVVAGSLLCPLDPSSGLIEQFSGYLGLEDIDLESFQQRTAPIDVLLGPERTMRSQVIKQADVIMLLALLPDAFDSGLQRKNFEYYEARCGHGSSLSPPIHSLVAARLGRLDDAEAYFRQTALIDLNDSMGNSAAGLHMGALGGLWQAAVFGFGGVNVQGKGLCITPRLPRHWNRLRFPIRWRGRGLTVDVSREHRQVEISLRSGPAMNVRLGGSWRQLRRGESLSAPLDGPEERT